MTAEAWVEHPDLVEFYSSHRRRPEDLYPSERRFLPWLAERSDSVLDVGCAAGGFLEIWSCFAPEVRYFGVDASHALVDAARRLHGDAAFAQGDCARGLDLPDAAADTVQALGWLHEEPDYADALRELWRLARTRLFFDVRLTDAHGDKRGRQRLALSGEWDGHTTTPYIAASWREFAHLLAELGADRLLGHGYWGAPSSTVEGMAERVCFATFVLEKGRRGGPMGVCLDLPLPWPDDMTVNVLPASELERLVPER